MFLEMLYNILIMDVFMGVQARHDPVTEQQVIRGIAGAEHLAKCHVENLSRIVLVEEVLQLGIA